MVKSLTIKFPKSAELLGRVIKQAQPELQATGYVYVKEDVQFTTRLIGDEYIACFGRVNPPDADVQYGYKWLKNSECIINVAYKIEVLGYISPDGDIQPRDMTIVDTVSITADDPDEIAMKMMLALPDVNLRP